MTPRPSLDALIVGGGPVGLLLGCRLAALGWSLAVLEASPVPRRGSRAIGIHPPSLKLMQRLGLLPRFLTEGIHIEQARVRTSRRDLGSVALSDPSATFPFVLSLPQARTEELLEERLCSLQPGCIRRGLSVVRTQPEPHGASVWAETGRGRVERWRARWVIGCDGRHSAVRNALQIPFSGAARPESYVMGDFDDDTDLGEDAAIFLTDEGLVESFPLPGKRRRWVAQAPNYRQRATAQQVARLVEARTGCALRIASATALSAFGVEQRCARRLFVGHHVLAGDAAHVISPFGGQGMNVGWQDAWALSERLQRIADGADHDAELRAYETERGVAARRAMHRAALNGWIGRRPRRPRLRNALVAGMLNALPSGMLARLFTMGPLLARPPGLGTATQRIAARVSDALGSTDRT